MTPGRRSLLVLAAFLGVSAAARADNGADAVTAVAQLTAPARLAALSEETFVGQLGPALGWLHVARRRDISPEAIIARAFLLNGMDPEQARATRDALLRNLARADEFALFTSSASAQALALGKPALIPTGAHHGHLAAAALAPGASPRSFADLVLRSDDESPLRPRRQPSRPEPRPASRRRSRVVHPEPIAPVPTEYDDNLPAR